MMKPAERLQGPQDQDLLMVSPLQTSTLTMPPGYSLSHTTFSPVPLGAVGAPAAPKSNRARA